jgi:hypothetical protein
MKVEKTSESWIGDGQECVPERNDSKYITHIVAVLLTHRGGQEVCRRSGTES